MSDVDTEAAPPAAVTAAVRAARAGVAPSQPQLPAAHGGGGRGVTWRSLLVGTTAVAAVCGLTPYNDYVLSDMSLAAGFLPLAAVLVLFVVVVGINAPLNRFAPRYALTTPELAVVLLMTLVGCALPNWGLTKFFVPTLVAPFRHGATDNEFWRAFGALGLPGWLFPVEDVATGNTSRVATWFYTRVPPGEPIPWAAWAVPLAGWGVFVLAMLATLAALAKLVTHQWLVGERLPFPILQVQASLIESPLPGRCFNDLLRRRALWVALAAVFVVHSLTAMSSYYPQYYPKIPLGYDFSGIFADAPFVHLETKVKKATVSLIVVGLTFFIRSRVAFSLWCTYLLFNFVNLQARTLQAEIPSAAWQDQHLGASLVFIAATLWLGRQHWGRVVRNAFGVGRDNAYRFSFWTVVIGLAVMAGWLMAVGVRPWVAGLVVLFIVAAHVVVARVAAETGLPYFRSGINVGQVYTNLPVAAMGGRDVYFASVFTVLGPLTSRDSLTGMAVHGMGATEQAGIAQRERRGIGAAVAWALLLGVVVACASTLYCQYSYPTPASADVVPQRNYFGADYVQRREVVNPVVAHAQGRYSPKAHSPALHFGIGVGVTLVLEVFALRWQAWPFLPVGYVAVYGAFLANAWFSIFIGWLLKSLIVRYGGTQLYEWARPIFVGLILGEALAAAVWLLVNAAVVMSGGDSQPIKFML